jgi:hypothetical protein
MSFIGLILGIISSFVLFLTIIPLLGWINWINIPFAILGLIFSLIGFAVDRNKKVAIAGIAICCVVIIFGAFRLQACGGFI